MTKTEIVLWILAVALPITFLTVALVVLSRNHPPTPCDDPNACDNKAQGVAPTLATPVMACGDKPVQCNLNKPNTCGMCGEDWSCQSVTKNDTDYGVEGSFCLPKKPTSACTQVPVDSNERMQGVWRWQGWGGVNLQKWECSCPYPNFYPMDTSGGISAGACKKSSNLCRGGTWTYPCERPVVCTNPADPSTCALDINACANLTPEKRDALLGANVLAYGRCECADGDRLTMDGATGMPECVADTCTATPSCDAETPCPGGASCVNGFCARATSSCDKDQDCGKGGVCEANGTCSWGHWKTLPIPPYVFGQCECPQNCRSMGSLCVC